MNYTDNNIARLITRNSSWQTYITIWLLVRPTERENAYRGYAYFRWLDDQVDDCLTTKQERISFIRKQKMLIQDTYAGHPSSTNNIHENLIIELIKSDTHNPSGLTSFIKNFFWVIEFDAERKGRLISERELKIYSDKLGTAVTDCIEYFIGEPESKSKLHKYHYHAATAAHMVHMLRDYTEDVGNGFINIPKEYLNKTNLSETEFDSPKFRLWVKQRSLLAQKYFRYGKVYIDKLPNVKQKMAARWYCCRFDNVLRELEKNGYMPDKINREGILRAGCRFIYTTLEVVINHRRKA